MEKTEEKTITPKKVRKSTRMTQKKIEQSIRQELNKAYKRINSIEDKIDRTVRKLDISLAKFDKVKDVIKKQIGGYADKMESLEDTFFTLYHNIKKNQWKYVAEPEDWWNDYMDLKKHYKDAIKKEAI